MVEIALYVAFGFSPFVTETAQSMLPQSEINLIHL